MTEGVPIPERLFALSNFLKRESREAIRATRSSSGGQTHFAMLLALITLATLSTVRATYYPWPPGRQGWSGTERSNDDIYPGNYLGEGSATWHRGAAEMSCTLNRFEGYVVSNVVWTKLRGNYEEPFYPCPYCYDDRVRAYDHLGKSILLIQSPGHMDQGTYRCTATAQYPDGRLTTIYQVVQLH